MTTKSIIKVFLLVYIASFITFCSSDSSTPNDPNNIAPRIVFITASPSALTLGGSTELTCFTTDEDNDILNYTWSSDNGSFPNGNSRQTVNWKAPEAKGEYTIRVSVSDDQATVIDSIIISVVDDPCDGITTISLEGKLYNVVSIGAQCWMKENLNVGTMINDSLEMTNQGVLEKYCYENNENNCDEFGGLYQWNEAMQYSFEEYSQGICPDGWHIPSSAELRLLIQTVSDNGNSLKAIGQGSGPGAGNDESGFSALLSGMRFEDTNFGYLDNYGIFWSSTFNAMTFDAAVYMSVYSNNDNIVLDMGKIFEGVSVRCIKN
jgi:uncharacterized protein (TIGR02145 family)